MGGGAGHMQVVYPAVGPSGVQRGAQSAQAQPLPPVQLVAYLEGYPSTQETAYFNPPAIGWV